jgi:ABC-type Fe3+/spermidine/putrescine transport system ATPase subunit
MNQGKIIEAGVPERIFDQPENYHTATLVGFENIFKGEATSNGSGSEVQLENGLRLKSSTNYSGSVYACVRPEKIRISNDKGGDDWSGKTEEVFREQSGYRIIVSTKNFEVTVITRDKLVKGETVAITIPKESVHLIQAK